MAMTAGKMHLELIRLRILSEGEALVHLKDVTKKPTP